MCTHFIQLQAILLVAYFEFDNRRRRLFFIIARIYLLLLLLLLWTTISNFFADILDIALKFPIDNFAN